MEENEIKFNICGQKQVKSEYRMNKTSKMLEMKLFYSEKVEIPVNNLKFTFKQTCIGDEETPGVLGMENGDTVDVSFIDKMELDPKHIKDHARGQISYQDILKVAELTGKLLTVWKTRVAVMREGDTMEERDFVPFHGLRENFYQMTPQSRGKLLKYSVEKLFDIFKSEEEIGRFKDCIFKVAKFTKMCIYNILAKCFPVHLPYPVLRIIADNLLAVNGLEQIGQATKQGRERKCMERLYYSLADIFKHLKVLMFNTDSEWHNGTPLYTLATQKREDLLSRLLVLSELDDGTNDDVHTVPSFPVKEELVENYSENWILALRK